MKFCAMLSWVNPDSFLALAPAAEEHGWDTLALSDHVVNPDRIEARYPYGGTGERMWDHSAPWPDVWVATGMMAAVTRRLRFTQIVYVLPMRDPFTVAKALGTCARMSGYRVSLGLGLGWMHDEFEILGHEFAHRGARADEMVNEDRLEHFAWGVMPEIAAEVGERAGDLEAEVAERAAFLQALAADGPGDPDAIRSALGAWHRHVGQAS